MEDWFLLAHSWVSFALSFLVFPVGLVCSLALLEARTVLSSTGMERIQSNSVPFKLNFNAH